MKCDSKYTFQDIKNQNDILHKNVPLTAKQSISCPLRIAVKQVEARNSFRNLPVRPFDIALS